MMSVFVVRVAIITLGAAAACAAAQEYPSRLIRIVVAQAPASGPDLVGRTLAQKFTETWGQQAIVDNRAGANGIIGGDLVAKAKADGYTLLVGASSAITMNPFVYKSLPHDPLRDLAPVSQTASNVMALVVAPTLPAANVQALVALAKSHPHGIVFASAGIGNLTHLSAELFANTVGVKLVHAPYKGSTPAWIELMSGQVALMFTTTQGIAPHLERGKLKLLATCSEIRAGAFPQTPTLIESGYPGLVMTGWTGLFAPSGTPANIVAKLSREVVRVLALPEIRARMESQGSEAVASAPEVFSAFVKSEAAKWQKVIRAAGLEQTQ